jgi:aryl carrier-like protein
VEATGNSVSPTQLRAALAEDLPDYMVPTAWVHMDALPLTPNGKLDRAALPTPDGELKSGADFVAPADPTERALALIWEAVLNVSKVGRHSDIFELGADSIQLFQITARARRAGLALTAKQLIKHRTIASLVTALAGEEPEPTGARPGRHSIRDFKRSRASN